MEHTTLPKFVSRVLVLFAFVVVFLIIAGPLVGEQAADDSTLFVLGKAGISYQVLYQVMLLSVYINIIRLICYSQWIIRRMMLLWRTVIMLVLTAVGSGGLSILFGWFPASEPIAWAIYLGCFLLCAAFSTLAMVIHNRNENTKVTQKLEEYKRARESDISEGRQ